MPKIENIEIDGEIIGVLPAGNYNVKPRDIDIKIICKKSGKMKAKHINIIEGDWVKVEVSAYDMTKGRIVYRYSEKPNL